MVYGTSSILWWWFQIQWKSPFAQTVVRWVIKLFDYSRKHEDSDLLTSSTNFEPTYTYLNSSFSSAAIKMDPLCGSTLQPLDFSSSAEFFVATGVLSFLYTILIVVLYIFAARLYEENQLVPVVVSYFYVEKRNYDS